MPTPPSPQRALRHVLPPIPEQCEPDVDYDKLGAKPKSLGQGTKRASDGRITRQSFVHELRDRVAARRVGDTSPDESGPDEQVAETDAITVRCEETIF